ncbi:MAG TPA: MBL fold metallo-hydrolase [Pseudonocardia sp.]|jgi:L-ascorbate metabolism protein UlaG (beta-lactamase superfamily)|nr:MBL fold metallo-hydrolase [Pseudonocardia sp.]
MTEFAWLDWFGCATFRLRTRPGVTIFLDAYLDRVPSAQQSGVGIDDIIEADWILVGHSHFDHLYGAERLAARTGATIVGSYESIRIMAECGVPEAQLMPVSGGETIALGPDMTARVLPSMHSCTWASDPMPLPDATCIGDTGLTYQQRRALHAKLAENLPALSPETRGHLRTALQGDRGDGGALIFVIETPAGSVLFQDTAGCWTHLLEHERPDVAILAGAGRGHRDGEAFQGTTAEFVAEQTTLLGQPERVILCHHDDWLPGFSHPTNTQPLHQALSLSAPRTELVEIGYNSGYPVLTHEA